MSGLCRFSRLSRLWPAGMLLFAVTLGCGRAAPLPVGADQEIWDVQYIGGVRAGYNRTRIKHENAAGRELVRVEGENHTVIKRGAERIEQEVCFTSLETPDGKLLEFESEVRGGPTAIGTTGRVDGNRLKLTTTTLGKTASSSIAWSPEAGGPYAIELSLRRQPMRPGEQRTVKLLMAGANMLLTTDLVAADYESVTLPHGTYDLLRIAVTIHLPDGATIAEVAWADRTGDVLRNRSDAMKVETCRSTRAEALDQTGVGQLDLDALLSVKPDRPLALGHGSSLVRYRVHLKDGDPAAAFISGPSQKVVSLDAHTAEITVYGLRPGVTGGNSAAPDEKPGDDDRAPNNLIQSDNAEIVAMAAQAAGAEKDPWKTAVALEGYVRRTVATTTKDSSGAFSTAADVARTREGDCKAHAVLLAALARARGIPARVAIGLVYVARTGVFGYHMWNEVYIDTRWFPLDATLGRGGIGGGHLKLAHRSLAGATAVGSFFPVMKVSGRLQIDVLEEK